MRVESGFHARDQEAYRYALRGVELLVLADVIGRITRGMQILGEVNLLKAALAQVSARGGEQRRIIGFQVDTPTGL